MSGAVTPLDYTRKDRSDWTTWDWICALRDNLTGDAAGERFRIIDRIREDLSALIAARGELPHMTELQMMARYGSHLRNAVNALYGETINIGDEHSLTQEELDLINEAVDGMDTDSEDEILEAEQNLRFERFRLDASHYIAQMLRTLQEDESSEHPSEERQTSIKARIYVADDLRRKLEERAGLFRTEASRFFYKEIKSRFA